MNSTEVLNLAAEFTAATGVSSENWPALISWLEKTKGAEIARAFEKRCESPI